AARGRRRLSEFQRRRRARRASGSGAGRVAAAARAGSAAPVRAVHVARLGRAMSHNWRTGRAVGAGGGAVVAEPVRARAGLADGAGHEAGLLATRRARRAARDLALAVHVQVTVAHRVPGVMGDAAHVLAVVAGAGQSLLMVARTESTRGSLQPARAADADRPTAPASASARTSSFRRMGTSFVGTPGPRGSWTLRASAVVSQPKNQRSSRTEDSENHGFGG